jgi:hypothetical protein
VATLGKLVGMVKKVELLDQREFVCRMILFNCGLGWCNPYY